jgi:hypothetical protein
MLFEPIYRRVIFDLDIDTNLVNHRIIVWRHFYSLEHIYTSVRLQNYFYRPFDMVVELIDDDAVTPSINNDLLTVYYVSSHMIMKFKEGNIIEAI